MTTSANNIRVPRVVVAMATYNGLPWIGEQVRSILGQRGVEVSLVVSDDGSTDGTRAWLEKLAALDDRVTLLPKREGPPGVGPNFLYLVEKVQAPAGGYVAFSDQDDLWHPNKLRHQVDYLQTTRADATSSNVLAFNARGERRIIRKDQPQRKWDFIFEAPGPGSTFVLTERAFQTVQNEMAHVNANAVWLHDWLIYALVRSANFTWMIDGRPHVAYRQHDKNLLGAHRGRAAVHFRWSNLRNGKYREQFQLVAAAARAAGERAGREERWLKELDHVDKQLHKPKNWPRPGLLPHICQIRRRKLEGLALGGLGCLGLW